MPSCSYSGGMAMNTSTEKSWEHFWRAGGAGGAYARAGRSHPCLDQAWLQFFRRARGTLGGPIQSLDLAAGSGVMIGYMLQAWAEGEVEIHCLDTSPAAIASIGQRFPATVGHVADARQTGLADAAYDIVTSQFGIEYAGSEAFAEAMRLVRPGGYIGLLIHCKDGQIERDGRRNRDAVARVLQAGLMEHAMEFFACAFAYQAGGGGLSQVQRSAATLQLSMDTTLEVVRQYGPAIANHTIARLLDDIGAMGGDLTGYDRGETMQWLRGMDAELRAFHERMAALCTAAVGVEDFARLEAALGERGFDVLEAGLAGAAEAAGPLAWCVQARKRPLQRA